MPSRPRRGAAETAGNGRGGILVGDVGGTKARFGIVDADGRLTGVRILSAAAYPTLIDAASDYLAGCETVARPRQGAIAVACPILGDRVSMTNHPWSFSIGELRRDLGLERLEVLNDFAALALAVPALGSKELATVKEGEAEANAPLTVLGPGTGLGVAMLVPAGGSWLALPSEGGHRDLAATSPREWQVVRQLERRFGHVSVERAVSGPGLVNLYEALSRLAKEEPQALDPAAVVAGARDRSSPACVEAVALFAGWLGAMAGDLALTLGSRGGVYLGGGVLEKMGGVFDAGRFRERFLAKGRFRAYLEPIPVHSIRHPQAALIGAARALRPGQ